jgi:hypothetical protein
MIVRCSSEPPCDDQCQRARAEHRFLFEQEKGAHELR